MGDGRRVGRGRLQDVPALPRPQPEPEGHRSCGGGRARYEEFQALDDVSLEVPAGTTFGLIGENGSGKSTLLKCMARILRPDAGSDHRQRQDLGPARAGRRLPPRAVGQGEHLPQRRHPRPRRRRTSTASTTRSSSSPASSSFIDTPVKNYSSGMYVRLGLLGGHQRRPRRAAGRRGAGRRRRAVPAPLQREVRRAAGAEQDHRGGVARPRAHAHHLRRAGLARARQAAHGRRRRRRDRPATSPRCRPTARRRGRRLGARWGSGEARIEHIELLGARRPAHQPAAHRRRRHLPAALPGAPSGSSGRCSAWPSTTSRACWSAGPTPVRPAWCPTTSRATASSTCAVDRLMLLPGTYDISASLYDYAIVHPFDFRQRVVRFDVDPGTPHETFGGVMSLDGRWIDHRGAARREPGPAPERRRAGRRHRRPSAPPSTRASWPPPCGAVEALTVAGERGRHRASSARRRPRWPRRARSVAVSGAGIAAGVGAGPGPGRHPRRAGGLRAGRGATRRRPGSSRALDALDRHHEAAVVAATVVDDAERRAVARPAGLAFTGHPLPPVGPDAGGRATRRRCARCCPGWPGWRDGPSSKPSARSTRSSTSPSPASTWPGGCGWPAARSLVDPAAGRGRLRRRSSRPSRSARRPGGPRSSRCSP